MSDAALEASVRQTYADYLAAFQQADAAEAVQAYFQFPCLLLSPHGDTVITTSEGIGQLFAAMKTRLAAQDYARSTVQDMSVKLMSDSLAAISLNAIRYDSKGVELERLGCFYLLRKTSEQWRFVQLAMHDAERVVRLG